MRRESTHHLEPERLAARNLVIVAGHAVLAREADPADDRNWRLLSYQEGEAACYVEHVRCAVELTAGDPSALLLFSGGQSRCEAGPRSEAASYFWIAEYSNWFAAGEVAARSSTEEFARDSYENLLFGLCRFKEILRYYPERVTFVSWNFKSERVGLHREAIRWPSARFRYAAPNDPPELAQALAAEARTRAKYVEDPYSSGPGFRAKREARNPFRRQHGYRTSCPELAGLFDHCGPAHFSGPLPWS